jgi:hypothetical protein
MNASGEAGAFIVWTRSKLARLSGRMENAKAQHWNSFSFTSPSWDHHW